MPDATMKSGIEKRVNVNREYSTMSLFNPIDSRAESA
jgi:hypothetical protein